MPTVGTAPQLPPSPQRREAAEPSRRAITVAEFRAMGAAGLFRDGPRVELLDGAIYDMSPVNRPHKALTSWLDEELHEALRRRYTVFCQNAVEPEPTSQPLPDAAVLRRRDDHYAAVDATAPDILLLIEVADSSLRHDTEVKAPAYGRDGVVETWVVSVPGRELLQYTGPCEDGYRSVVTHPAGARVTATAVPELTLDTGAMFAILPNA